jgi:hypothetical protein
MTRAMLRRAVFTAPGGNAYVMLIGLLRPMVCGAAVRSTPTETGLQAGARPR